MALIAQYLENRCGRDRTVFDFTCDWLMFFVGIQISFTNTKSPDIIVESGSTINQHNMTLTGLGPLN
jgi:hypothetical protein